MLENDDENDIDYYLFPAYDFVIIYNVVWKTGAFGGNQWSAGFWVGQGPQLIMIRIMLSHF